MKKRLKKFIILWVVNFIILSSISSGVYGYTAKECGEALAGYCWNFYKSRGSCRYALLCKGL